MNETKRFWMLMAENWLLLAITAAESSRPRDMAHRLEAFDAAIKEFCR